LKYIVKKAFSEQHIEAKVGDVFIPAVTNFGTDNVARLVADGAIELLTADVPAEAPVEAPAPAKKKTKGGR
jgi:hypothetical protein